MSKQLSQTELQEVVSKLLGICIDLREAVMILAKDSQTSDEARTGAMNAVYETIDPVEKVLNILIPDRPQV